MQEWRNIPNGEVSVKDTQSELDRNTKFKRMTIQYNDYCHAS